MERETSYGRNRSETCSLIDLLAVSTHYDMSGTYLERIWNVFGTYLERTWNIFGTYLERIWNVFGTHLERMVCIWNVFGTYGVYLERIWNGDCKRCTISLPF